MVGGAVVLLCFLALPYYAAAPPPQESGEPGESGKAAGPATNTSKPSASSQDLSAAYQKLLDEYQKAMQEFSAAYRAAATDAERDKVVKEKYPRTTFAQRFLELADRDPKSPVAIDALAWIVENVQQGKELDAALVRLRDHLDSDKLDRVSQAMSYAVSPEAEKMLRALIDKSPHRSVRGQATFSLGKLIHEKHGDRDAEAEKLFEAVVEKYADLPGFRGTLGKASEAMLFEIRNLSVGKPAPDIEGQDVDGKRFKLSDYRGKVVVLDFWGDW